MEEIDYNLVDQFSKSLDDLKKGRFRKLSEKDIRDVSVALGKEIKKRR